MSTGGAVAFGVILLGFVIGISVALPSIQSAGDDLKGAREELSKELLEIRNTDLSISSCDLNATTSVMNLTLSNSGTTVWDVGKVNVLVNGTIVPSSVPSTYCYPNQELLIRVDNVTSPSSVMVVGPWGVGSACEV
ncbi:MAG: hypothetical protein KAH57_09430 [Thermoplasmata archaeon]|nr:hypothetical protein [Thermoplasmata archaeon]